MAESFAITLQSVSRFEKGADDAILKSVSADFKEGHLIAGGRSRRGKDYLDAGDGRPS